MKFERDWKESWIDRMGLIVALSGNDRYVAIRRFKEDMATLESMAEVEALREAIRQRFTPSSYAGDERDGCKSAMAAVKEVRAA